MEIQVIYLLISNSIALVDLLSDKLHSLSADKRNFPRFYVKDMS